MQNVTVVGAGVIGLTSGIRLLEAGFEVGVLTAGDADTTTSYAAGASWGPHLVPITPATTAWGLRTLDVHRELAGDPATGVRIGSGIEGGAGIPAWAAPLDGVETCGPDEVPAGMTGGWRHRTPLIDMPAHLAYLRRRLLDGGGTITTREIGSFDELAAATVVNCTGMGARALTGDDDLVPVRGQVVIVENPGLTDFFVHDLPGPDLTYYFPHGDIVVLGGQGLTGIGDREVDLEAAAATIERCAAIEPRLRDAPVLGYRVGLRPYRSSGVRLERDGRIIHNYGHGGAGVTLSWGCADAVVDLAP